MKLKKIEAGSLFPEIVVNDIHGAPVNIAKRHAGMDWKMVVVYRGKHCPLCTKYLNALEGYVDALTEIKVGIVAVSADSESQLKSHLKELDVHFPMGYGLSIEQMQALGLYISVPRSEQETDHPFAEPGLFVINPKGQVQVVDISNGPFARPELESLVSGLRWIKEPNNDYPIRGTYP